MKYANHFDLFVYMMATVQVLGVVEALAADELRRRSGHPYLTYSDTNIARLKERVRNEPAIADAWQQMLASANRMIEQPAGGRGRRGRGRNEELLCLAYRMTGDKRFGERVKESLFSHEFGGRSATMLMRRTPPWHHARARR